MQVCPTPIGGFLDFYPYSAWGNLPVTAGGSARLPLAPPSLSAEAVELRDSPAVFAASRTRFKRRTARSRCCRQSRCMFSQRRRAAAWLMASRPPTRVRTIPRVPTWLR